MCENYNSLTSANRVKANIIDCIISVCHYSAINRLLPSVIL